MALLEFLEFLLGLGGGLLLGVEPALKFSARLLQSGEFRFQLGASGFFRLESHLQLPAG